MPVFAGYFAMTVKEYFQTYLAFFHSSVAIQKL